MQRRDLVIQKLKEVRDRIPEVKAQGVMFRDTAEFSEWRDTGTKWLKLGLPNTSAELEKFLYVLEFAVARVREGPDDYDEEDEEAYANDCDRAVSIVNSAIENLEMELVTEPPKVEVKGGRERPKYRDVTISEVDTVVLGDRNVVSIVDSITISDFLNILDREVEANVADPDQKRGLRQKVKELLENPAFNTILGMTVGTVLRGTFGQ